jgi:hypothetical protein
MDYQSELLGCTSNITQRALGADLKTARTGILFAGFLKILMPVIVMLPGIAAWVLYKNGHTAQMDANFASLTQAHPDLDKSQHLYKIKDDAYSAVLNFLPTGLKGLSLAALTAAMWLHLQERPIAFPPFSHSTSIRSLLRRMPMKKGSCAWAGW